MNDLSMQNEFVSLESQMNLDVLNINSTIAELSLHTDRVEISCLTKQLIEKFQGNSIIPGVILTQKNKLYGMISRRHLLERMSRPYALEIFLKRPISVLYEFETKNDLNINILPANTSILKAAQYVLRRPAEKMYEPLIVQAESGNHSLLDVPNLLYAQSHLHKLTNKLLKEQTYAQIVQAEKMASLGRMVAGIAHEIRNPVNCIHGNMGFLHDYCGDLIKLVTLYQQEIQNPPEAIAKLTEEIELDFLQEDLYKVLQSLQTSSVRTAKIVTSLHNFSRMDEKIQQIISIPECLDGTLLILNNRIKKKIQVNIKYEQDLPEILGYSGQLSQVFMNLIANTLDALEEKSAVTTDKNWQPKISITISSQSTEINEKKEWICIEIADNADGMSQEVQSQIFGDFFTTKALGKGTGLGLAISHEIITQKHAGKLEFKSKIGEGTIFSIFLPIGNMHQ